MIYLRKEITDGTVISGTLRTEDLLDALSTELERLVKADMKYQRIVPTTDYSAWATIHINRALIYDARLLANNDASEIVDELFDALNNYAPEGMYFGAHEDDGADFGWWEFRDE